MRKIVLSMFVSVDGCINGPGGAFIGPEWSADLDNWTMEMVDRFDTLVYGRRAWQDMAEYWPSAPGDANTPGAARRLAQFMNESRKLVFSRTMANTDAWHNSTLARQSVAEELAREKSLEGRDIVIFAGANFAQSAEATGLIDEYALLTIPELFGGGSRLFGDTGTRRTLKLIESRTMDTGAVLARYAVAGIPPAK